MIEIPLSKAQPGGDRLSVAAVCLDGKAALDLKQFIREAPFLRLQTELQSYLAVEDASLAWMQSPAPDICLLDFDNDRAAAITAAERIHERLPNTALFAISAHAQPDLIIEAMRCGCSEYIIKPVGQEQLLETIARIGARKREKREQSGGQVLTLIGAKGGTGTTTLATHLAAILARSCSRKTILIDLHPAFGEAALFLGITKHQYHFYELVDSLDRLDADLLQSFVLHHPSGLDLLPAPEVGEVAHHLMGEAITQAVEFIRNKYDYVVLDCPPNLTDQTLAVIPRSDRVFIITVPEVPALRNAARLLEQFRKQELPQNRVEVIVNRHSPKNAVISDAQIEKVIRRKIFLKVPNQYEQVIRTVNAGYPSAELANSQVGASVLSWAETLGAKLASPQPRKVSGKSIFGFFGRPKTV